MQAEDRAHLELVRSLIASAAWKKVLERRRQVQCAVNLASRDGPSADDELTTGSVLGF